MRICNSFKKVEPMRIDTITVLKPTKDYWYPNFKGNRVQVSIHIPDNEYMAYNPSAYTARVSVWGADDCGMEKDFFGSEGRKKAKELFHLLVNEHEYVNFTTVKNYGLISA